MKCAQTPSACSRRACVGQRALKAEGVWRGAVSARKGWRVEPSASTWRVTRGIAAPVAMAARAVPSVKTQPAFAQARHPRCAAALASTRRPQARTADDAATPAQARPRALRGHVDAPARWASFAVARVSMRALARAIAARAEPSARLSASGARACVLRRPLSEARTWLCG
jgi:hypothetical protein